MGKTKYRNRTNTPTVLQMEAVECGAASLAMILGYYKRFIPLDEMRVLCGVSRDGSNAGSLLRAARNLGFEAKGFRRSVSEIQNVKLPAIIFWNFNHFVVLEGICGDRFYINDPASGKRVVMLEEFSTSFTGVVLEFTPGSNFKEGGQKPDLIHPVMKRISGSEKILGYIILTGLLLVLPGLVIPSFSQFFVDKILINRMTGFFKPLILAMGLTAVIQGYITWLQNTCIIRFQTKMSMTSAERFFEHIFRLPMSFFSQRMPGEIANRISLNDSVSELIAQKLTVTVINVFSIVFFGVLMLRYDIILTLLCLLSAVINFSVLKLVAERRETLSKCVQQETGKLYGLSMSGVGMIETLKATGSENDFFMQWSGQQAKVVNGQQSIAAISHATSAVPVVVNKLLSIGILAIGALRIINGDMTMGMLVAFQGLMGNFTGPVSTIMGLGAELQSGKADLQRLDDVMTYKPVQRFADNDHSKKIEYTKLNGRIELQNVAFGYNEMEPPLISNFNLTLQPGSRVALVGGSGSGKSTIAKLIARLYEQREGEILYDGKPSQKIDKQVFTSSIAMVDQDITLFAGTIKDNLTMWNVAISDADYIQAAKDACIHDIISARSGGYESVVDECGANFSGGQRQRLEIARALAGNPRVIVMDEATSALDPVTEKMVDENIRRRGCACIIVAHRLSTIRDCDEIIVLDKGKIVERGTHNSLVDAGGVYCNLVRTM